MRLGWRAFLRNKFRKKTVGYSIGIAIDHDAVTLCALKLNTDKSISLLHENVVSLKTWSKHLANWVNEHNLEGASAHVAFSVSWYQQVQIDRPAVEDSEMPSAIKWSAQELLGDDEPKAFDFFDLPVPLAGNKKVNVVAINENALIEAVNACSYAGIWLKGISVEEVVTCNIPLQTEHAVLTLIQNASDEICLNIVKSGVLYFSRRLKGFENLNSFSADELNMGVADSLSVQIQRSMDYYESQLRQAPVKDIRLKLDTPHLAVVVSLVQQAVTARVAFLESGVVVPQVINEQRLNYAAIGAAIAPYSQLDHTDSERAT